VAQARENRYAAWIAINDCGERYGGSRGKRGLPAMKSLTRLVLVAAAFSVFAASSFSALAEDKKGGKAPAGQVGGKGGAKDLAAKGLGGKDAGGKGGGGKGGGGDHGDGVGSAVGDAVGGTVGGAVGGALGGFLGSLGH
jgi:hypothetical protein